MTNNMQPPQGSIGQMPQSAFAPQAGTVGMTAPGPQPHPGQDITSGMPIFPGPTPSPFPPSPNMPGPDMQQAGMPPNPGSAPDSHDSGTGGHKCGKSSDSHSHAEPSNMPPQSGYYNPPLLHEMYQVGPNLLNYGYGFPPFAQPYNGTLQSQPNSTFLGMNLSDSNFWKGALIGAGVALLLTNEPLQKALLKAGAKAFTTARRGVEELKEKFEDIQAELRQKAAEK